MRLPNPELEVAIRERTLTLLLSRDPGEIGMRDIALACGVTAATVYRYFESKEALFNAIKLDCLDEMDRRVAEGVSARRAAVPTGGTGTTPARELLRAGLAAFRDWCLENPRLASLVMEGFDPDLNCERETMERYYRSVNLASELVGEARAAGEARSRDPRLAVSLAIAALWGAIEAQLRKRSYPEYWGRGTKFTDAMIDMCLGSIFLDKDGNE